LIPINMANIHWFLAVVLPQRRVVDTYDSLGSASDWMLQCIVQSGQDDARTSGHPRGRWQKHKVRYRKQDNGKDCGVFVLKRMDHISRDIAPERMTGSMNFYRRRICSGSKHHHVGLSSGRSDLLTSSVRRRNCPGNRPIAQPPPNGRRGTRQSPGGSRSPKHSWFYQTTTGTASPLSINQSQTRTPVAKVATPNAPNRQIPPKRKVQTSSRGVGETTGEKPRPRPNPISPRSGQVIPLLARIAIFWDGPRRCGVHC